LGIQEVLQEEIITVEATPFVAAGSGVEGEY
jgi:hypothetical protein